MYHPTSRLHHRFCYGVWRSRWISHWPIIWVRTQSVSDNPSALLHLSCQLSSECYRHYTWQIKWQIPAVNIDTLMSFLWYRPTRVFRYIPSKPRHACKKARMSFACLQEVKTHGSKCRLGLKGYIIIAWNLTTTLISLSCDNTFRR